MGATPTHYDEGEASVKYAQLNIVGIAASACPVLVHHEHVVFSMQQI